jgi:DNA modification methylase
MATKQKQFREATSNLVSLPSQLADLARPLSATEIAEIRPINGFPRGDESNIQAMSIPPYYTACPNPFIPKIIDHWKSERQQNEIAEEYHREPFATDVSEGKQDPIYKIHSYHTKVPPRAIVQYILHYTRPSDIVLDAFCGSGMTGVAAQLCGLPDAKMRIEINSEWTKEGKRIPEWGARHAILCDLSPAATTIAANYNLPVDATMFEKEASRLLLESKNANRHFYNDGDEKNPFNYGVWSQIFLCPQCSSRINFMEQAFDVEIGDVRDSFACPSCNAQLNKKLLQKAFVSEYDPFRGVVHQHTEYELFLISRGSRRKSKLGKATASDKKLAQDSENISLPTTIPVVRFPLESMYHGSRLAPKGVEFIHDLYFRRQLFSFADFWQRTCSVDDNRLRSALRFLSDQIIPSITKLARYPQLSPLGGVYYLPSMVAENEPLALISSKLENLTSYFSSGIAAWDQVVISTNSAAQIPGLEDSSIDYIFTDPPFGENIYYADLNFIVEAWYGVFTETKSEAIIDKPKNKDLRAYEQLMCEAFKEYHRVLKPDRWITVVFHNSSNAVWNSIQQAMVQSGFVVADVHVLDKQQKSYRQVTSSTVKQDLVISAYKSTKLIEMKYEEPREETVWEFIREHLRFLPVFLSHDDKIEIVKERQAHALFDRMVAIHVQRGYQIPLDFSDFLRGLYNQFLERDGMFFLPEQAATYDVYRLRFQDIEQLSFYIVDEKSALQWIRNQLDSKTGTGSQTYSDLQPKFLQELHKLEFEDLPELRDLLKDNFLQDQLGRWYVPNPDDQADLDAIKQKALLREFGNYLRGKGKLKMFRIEAIRAGFGAAWREKNYSVILRAAERLPDNVLENDQQLLMYYHNASLRQSSKPIQENLL